MNSTIRTHSNDIEAFLIAREAMQTSEYKMFVEAYHLWYGRHPDDRQIDRIFGDYLKSADLPHFVKHFARAYIENHPERLRSNVARERRGDRAYLLALIINCVLVFGALALY